MKTLKETTPRTGCVAVEATAVDAGVCAGFDKPSVVPADTLPWCGKSFSHEPYPADAAVITTTRHVPAVSDAAGL
jgi:hypothetical protein